VLQLRGTDATEDMFRLVFKADSVAATPTASHALSLASGASWRLLAFAAAPVPAISRLFSA
jgi:hypothetical protein